MKKIYLLFFLPALLSCTDKPESGRVNFPKQTLYVSNLPLKENFWIFIMAGQSNMAGRGFVGPEDTIPSKHIYTINKDNRWILAKEPLHFNEPSSAGLDCGLSFARELLSRLNDTSVYIGLLPCAVGGSSAEQWLNDSTFRNVKLFSNLTTRMSLASEYGTIKGILWHQGENNANPEGFRNYRQNLRKLFSAFRKSAQNDSLQILTGEIGSFLNKKTFGFYPDSVNLALKETADSDKNISLIRTGDLTHGGDTIHFDSRSLRILGKRYAEKVKIK